MPLRDSFSAVTRIARLPLTGHSCSQTPQPMQRCRIHLRALQPDLDFHACSRGRRRRPGRFGRKCHPLFSVCWRCGVRALIRCGRQVQIVVAGGELIGFLTGQRSGPANSTVSASDLFDA